MSETYENGAKRSAKKLRYDLVCPEVIEGIARRATMGAEKYGDDNFKKGGEQFFKDAWNHLWQHYLDYKKGIPDPDDPENPLAQLEAIAWNIHAILWWEKNKSQE